MTQPTPFAFDQHEWVANEDADHTLLNQYGCRIAEDFLTADVTGITAPQIVLSTHPFNYGDQRELKLSVYGTLIGATGQVLVVRLYFNGVLQGSGWNFAVTANSINQGCFMMTTIFPGVAGAAESCQLQMSVVGSGSMTANAGFRLLVEDIGTTVGSYAT